MSDKCLKIIAPGIAASFLLAAIIDLYYGEEQFKWHQSTHTMVLLGIIAVGLIVSYIINKLDAWDENQ